MFYLNKNIKNRKNFILFLILFFNFNIFSFLKNSFNCLNYFEYSRAFKKPAKFYFKTILDDNNLKSDFYSNVCDLGLNLKSNITNIKKQVDNKDNFEKKNLFKGFLFATFKIIAYEKGLEFLLNTIHNNFKIKKEDKTLNNVFAHIASSFIIINSLKLIKDKLPYINEKKLDEQVLNEKDKDKQKINEEIIEGYSDFFEYLYLTYETYKSYQKFKN